MNSLNVIKRARESLEIEIAAIESLKERLDSRFEEAVVCYNTVLKIEPKNDLAVEARAFCINKIG